MIGDHVGSPASRDLRAGRPAGQPCRAAAGRAQARPLGGAAPFAAGGAGPEGPAGAASAQRRTGPRAQKPLRRRRPPLRSGRRGDGPPPAQPLRPPRPLWPMPYVHNIMPGRRLGRPVGVSPQGLDKDVQEGAMAGTRRNASTAGKVALVTGGSRGLGAATARRLADEGARVFVADLHPPGAGHGIDERITVLRGDVTDLADMSRIVEEVAGKEGRLDIVIANAGVAARGATLRASSPPRIDQLFDVNVRGVLNTIHASLPRVIESKGRLVLLSSVFAYVNGTETIPYAMSKAAVEQLGRGLRVELAAHGVSVTTAYFAMINTDMIRQSVDEDPAARALLNGLPKVLHKRISPEEAARAIVAGLRRGDARVVRPRRWSAVSALRGVLAPVMDSRMAGDGKVQRIVASLDAREGEDLLTS
ncbi:SDR family NAD(P)-dependent oxidoreductase [Streptomyces sp. P3]|uniref:SDR family NAD(P)-dependent oxidoreductase n=1 Tax=Streptomyces sp. P3 TaxID=2135430 RepID=UPI003466E0F0